MIPIVGIIISLYTLTRYFEMFDTSTWKGKIWLVLVILTTIVLMFGLCAKIS